jgi:putative inorganic carbon (HCO3(-)) transporter
LVKFNSIVSGISKLLLKIKFRTILFTLWFHWSFFMSFQTEVLMILGRNNTDSDGDFAANIESMSNISTDASNLERLNRWSCALQMFEEKPVLGLDQALIISCMHPIKKVV